MISAPSDGVERTVANHLAVHYGVLPRGELVGLICKHRRVQLRDDVPTAIAGATVTLDDGRVITTDATALYDFAGVTPRLACVDRQEDRAT